MAGPTAANARRTGGKSTKANDQKGTAPKSKTIQVLSTKRTGVALGEEEEVPTLGEVLKEDPNRHASQIIEPSHTLWNMDILRELKKKGIRSPNPDPFALMDYVESITGESKKKKDIKNPQSEVRGILQELNFEKYLKENNHEPEKEKKGAKRKKDDDNNNIKPAKKTTSAPERSQFVCRLCKQFLPVTQKPEERCHQCGKAPVEDGKGRPMVKCQNEGCNLRYCEPCLKNRYEITLARTRQVITNDDKSELEKKKKFDKEDLENNPDVETISMNNKFTCPSCEHVCICAKCMKLRGLKAFGMKLENAKKLIEQKFDSVFSWLKHMRDNDPEWIEGNKKMYQKAKKRASSGSSKKSNNNSFESEEEEEINRKDIYDDEDQEDQLSDSVFESD